MVVGKDDGWQFWIVSDTGRVRQVTVAESSFAAAEKLAKTHAGRALLFRTFLSELIC